MREDIRMKVIAMLNEYPDNMRKIAQLNYELAHPSQISATEMLEAMAFKKGNGERHSVGEVSDKTLYIAMNYRNEAFRENREVFKDYHSLLDPLERETERLRYYISLLNQRQAEVIRLYYFERDPWEAISQKMGLTPKPLRRLRDAGVDRLAEMYEFSGKLP